MTGFFFAFIVLLFCLVGMLRHENSLLTQQQEMQLSNHKRIGDLEAALQTLLSHFDIGGGTVDGYVTSETPFEVDDAFAQDIIDAEDVLIDNEDEEDTDTDIDDGC